MADKETLDVYDAKAGDYADLVGSDALPDTQLQAFLSRVPEGARLWDLGCGPGRSAALMARAGHRVYATDASAEMIALAAAQPGVEAVQATFDEISGTAVYDGIFANFSLLHADGPDLPRHIAALGRALKPGGVFHIGMKVGSGTKRDTLGRRYTYVTEQSLRQMLRTAGLEPVEHWTGEGPGLDGVVAPWIVMHAVRNA